MPDAIVIGSGPNGLAAAIRLAQAGRDVLVLEAEPQAGGAVRTQELTLPGYRHDTFSSVYPAAVSSPVFRNLPLEDHGLQWVHPEACAAHPLPDGSAGVLYRDVALTAESLNELHAGDGDRWAAFVQPYVDAADAVRHTMLSGFPPLRGPWQLMTEAGPLRLLDFARQVPASVSTLGRRLFQADGSRAWLTGTAMHANTPPGDHGSAIAAFYLHVLAHATGWPSPKGGARALSDALLSVLRAAGGEVHCGARVQSITSAAGRVTGVQTADGTTHRARTVVATVMPEALLAMTGDALAPWYVAALRRYRRGPGTVKVDWALREAIPWTAAATRRAGTVHVGGTEQDVLTAVRCSAYALPEQPFMLLGQQSVADPTRAPTGRHTAWAYTHAPARLLDAHSLLHGHVSRMEQQIERFAPGFGDRILARHVLGPADLERRDANLIGGDVGGGSYRLHQLVFRPLPKLDPYSTPLDGLYLGSAATFPGGAAHGVCGDAAARSALRHER